MAATVVPSHSHVEKHGYLFGYPIAHSMSPLMHQTIYDHLGLKWEQFFLESLDMALFIKLIQEPSFFGAAVTMPHKVAITKHLDEITHEGRLVGACNTVYFRQEGSKKLLVGTNTDVAGVREAFYQNVTDPDVSFHGRPGMVVGGGGAARAALYALRFYMKCKTIYLVNRDPSEVAAAVAWCKDNDYADGLIHVETAEQAATLEGPGAIVACVPDIRPSTPAELEARKIFETFLSKPHKGAILEMAYHPSPWTGIAELSHQAGWQVILGTEAMIYQGFEQDKLWTGRQLADMPVEQVKQVIAAKLKESRH